MATPGKIAKCLDPTSVLPPDVKFVFEDDKDTCVDDEEVVSFGGGNLGFNFSISPGGMQSSRKEVSAHKLILAIASDVFTRQFFGLMQSENVINIKDASKDVFEMMIDFIYNKKIEFINYDLDCLSKLYYLADKYDIEELRLEIIASIPEHEITIQNVIDVGILAEENSHHLPLSEALYDVAAAFLKQKFANKAENVYDFFSEAEASERRALALMKMMGRIKFLPLTDCDNCKQTKGSCLNGQEVKCNSAVVGAKVYCGSLQSKATINGPPFQHNNCPSGCIITLRFNDDGRVYNHHVYNCFFQCV